MLATSALLSSRRVSQPALIAPSSAAKSYCVEFLRIFGRQADAALGMCGP